MLALVVLRTTVFLVSRDEAAFALYDAESGSNSGPSEPSVHVDSMAASLDGVVPGMVLAAACGAAGHAQLAGEAHLCTLEHHEEAGAFSTTF